MLTLVERRKLEPAHERDKLLVRCGFAELAVRAGSVKLQPFMSIHTDGKLEGEGGMETYGVIALEVECFHDGVCDLFDAYFLIFAD